MWTINLDDMPSDTGSKKLWEKGLSHQMLLPSEYKKGGLTGENILLSTQSLVVILAHSSYDECYVWCELSQDLSIIMDLFSLLNRI